MLTDDEIRDTSPDQSAQRYWAATVKGDSFESAYFKKTGKKAFYNHVRINDSLPSPTLSSQSHCYTHHSQCRKMTYREWKRLGSFPDDYHAKTDKIGKYMIGMSVPPKMTEQVARAVCEQWLNVNYSELSNDNQAQNPH